MVPAMISALKKELEERRNYLGGEFVETIYIGGGTPSLLQVGQLNDIFTTIERVYGLNHAGEVTLEANPDDISLSYLRQLKDFTPVNRISFGIQSYHDHDLRLLNRRHNAKQAISCLEDASRAGFKDISADLIYGIPGSDLRKWEENLQLAMQSPADHLSAYHLTIEPGTSLHRMVENGTLKIITEEESHDQYRLLCDTARNHDFEHYEVSNFCRNGKYSKHNTNYWKQKKYLGVGPSAHSFDTGSRQWNHPDAGGYIEAMKTGGTHFEREITDETKRYNEYIMLSLRTFWGADTGYLQSVFGKKAAGYFLHKTGRFMNMQQMIQQGNHYRLTEAAWFVSDFIISGFMQEPGSVSKA